MIYIDLISTSSAVIFILQLRPGQVLQQNARQYGSPQGMKQEVTADIWAIYNAADLTQAEAELLKTVEKYATIASRLAN